MKKTRKHNHLLSGLRPTKAIAYGITYLTLALCLFVLPQENGIGLLTVIFISPLIALLLLTVWTIYFTLGRIISDIRSGFSSRSNISFTRLIVLIVVASLWMFALWLIALFVVKPGYINDLGFLALGVGLLIAAIISSWILYPAPLIPLKRRFKRARKKPKNKPSGWETL